MVATSADTTDLEISAQSATRLLKLLASEQRLLILCRLFDGEASVGDLSEHAHLAKAATSQHLAKMRAEGLVGTRRAGQTIYYSLKDPAAVKVIQALCEIYRYGPVFEHAEDRRSSCKVASLPRLRRCDTCESTANTIEILGRP